MIDEQMMKNQHVRGFGRGLLELFDSHHKHGNAVQDDKDSEDSEDANHVFVNIVEHVSVDFYIKYLKEYGKIIQRTHHF